MAICWDPPSQVLAQLCRLDQDLGYILPYKNLNFWFWAMCTNSYSNSQLKSLKTLFSEGQMEFFSKKSPIFVVLCMSENMSFWKTGENGYVVFMSFLDQIYVGWKNTLSAHWSSWAKVRIPLRGNSTDVPGQNHHHATLILRPGLPPRGQDRQEWLYCSAKACPSVHLQSTMSDLFLRLVCTALNIFIIKVTAE